MARRRSFPDPDETDETRILPDGPLTLRPGMPSAAVAEYIAGLRGIFKHKRNFLRDLDRRGL